MNWKKRVGIGTLSILLLLVSLCLLATYREFLQAQHNYSLSKAIQDNDSNAVLDALNAGADANALYGGDTPPVFSDQFQHLFTRLLHRKAKVISKAPMTALIFVLEKDMKTSERMFPPENPAIVRALLEHGADPNAKGFMEMTPLMRAALYDFTEDLRLLLQHGADIHAKDEDGFTALHIAAESTNTEDIKLLLAQGADINAQGKDGETPLMLAADHNRVEIAQVLLDSHADVNRKDKDGDMALDWAQQRQADDVSKLLRKAGAKARTPETPPEPAPAPNAKTDISLQDLLTLATRSGVPDVENTQDSEVYFWVSNQQLLWMQPDSAHKHFQMTLIEAQSGLKTPLTALNTIASPFMSVIKGGTVGYSDTKTVIQLYPTPISALSPDGKWLLWNSSPFFPDSWRAATLDGSQQRQWNNATNTDNVFWLPDSLRWMQFVGNKEDSGYGRIKIYSLVEGEKPQEVRIEGLGDLILLGVTNRRTVVGYNVNRSYRPNQSQVKMKEIGFSQKNEHARLYTIQLPKPAELAHALLSPSGDRIAWILTDGTAFSEKGELWISDSAGSQMHPLGRMEGDIAWKRNLHWLPDGKHLSFRHQGSMWTVPAP